MPSQTRHPNDVEEITYRAAQNQQEEADGPREGDNHYGDEPWNDLVNVKSCADSGAAGFAKFHRDDTSTLFLAKDFGFNIPVINLQTQKATVITHIVVKFKARYRHTSPSSTAEVKNSSLTIVKAGSELPTDGTNTDEWTKSYAEYEDEATDDLWYSSWTVGQVNDANTGVYFECECFTNPPNGQYVYADVDCISMTVHYN